MRWPARKGWSRDVAARIDAAAARAALAAGLASASQTLDAWSRLIAALATIGLLLPDPAVPLWKPLLACILLGGLGQLYFAARIAVDRPVFSLWAARWREPADCDADLAAFDRALAELGWRPALAESRDLEMRLSGVRRLLRRQMALLVVQAVALATLCGLSLAA